MYFVKTPAFVKPFYSNLWWRVPSTPGKVYLTFDDGPEPGVTDNILDVLSSYQAKATFFCLGKQVEKHPLLYRRILEEGHSVGNHTWNHLNGRKADNESYFEDVRACSVKVNSTLFRPPYGRITRSQVKELKLNYQLIMWDVLSGDFDENCSKEKCVSNVMNNVEAGSIVVFHDSLKASEKVLYALPKVLELLSNRNYECNALTPQILTQS